MKYKSSSFAIVPLSFRMIGVNMCLSLAAPFLPVEGYRKRLSSIQYCLFFALFNLSEIIFAATWMVLVRRRVISCNRLFNIGAVFVGIYTILVGLMYFVQDYFFPSMIILRVLLAISSSAFIIGLFALLYEYPTKIGYVFGVLETTTSICYVIFIPVASGLFQLGGMHYPFIVFGCLLLTVCLSTQTFVPRVPNLQRGIITEKGFLKTPSIWTALLLIFFIQASHMFICILLAISVMKMLRAPHYVAAFMYSTNKIAFLVSSSVSRITLDRWGCLKSSIMIAAFFQFLAFLLWTSPVLLQTKPSVYQSFNLVILSGLANGILMTGSFTVLKENASTYFEENNAAAHNMVSSCYFFFVQSGCFIGAILAGSLETPFGLPRAAEIMMAIWIALILASAPFILDASLAFIRSKKHAGNSISAMESNQRLPKMLSSTHTEFATTFPEYKLRTAKPTGNTQSKTDDTRSSPEEENVDSKREKDVKYPERAQNMEGEYSEMKDTIDEIQTRENSNSPQDLFDLNEKGRRNSNSEDSHSPAASALSHTELNNALVNDSCAENVDPVTDAQETNNSSNSSNNSKK